MGKWYVASERSMVASTNSFMQELYNIQTKHWEKQGVTGKQLEAYKRNYTDTVNTFMKILRAKNPEGKAIQRAANYVLFSPSMTFSRLKRPYVLLANKGSRMYAASLVSTEIGKIFLISAIANTIGNYYKDKKGEPKISSDIDPRSTNWGQVRVNDVHYDFGGGDIQFYRTIARLITGEMKNQAGFIKKVPRLSVLEQYAKSRETALIGIATELITGRDFQGNKLWEIPDWEEVGKRQGPFAKIAAKIGKSKISTPGKEKAFVALREMLKIRLPQFLGAMFESGINDGWASIFARGTSEFISQGTTSYPLSPAAISERIRNKIANDNYNKIWDDLGPKAQKKLRKKFPTIEQSEQEAKFTRRQRTTEFEIKYEPLELNKSVQKNLESLFIPIPSVSRRIATNWFLNDQRYENYRDLSSKYINTRLGKLFLKPGWVNLKEERKIERVTKEIEFAKELARRQIEKLANKESR
jgi:hypothetical protein